MTARQAMADLRRQANAGDAAFLQRFFKSGPGQYGAGDVFIGVRVPQTRAVAKVYQGLPLAEVQQLLDSEVHEDRLLGLIVLTLRYTKADAAGQTTIYDLYLKNVYAGRVNNWDLVDVTAPRIVGQQLLGRSHDLLFQLAASDNVWQKRVAVLSSFTFIAAGDANTSLRLAERLLHDPHDLVQKAVGWMLREIGKRCDRWLLLCFLDEYAHDMPRTTLRYSTEHLSPVERRHYLAASKNTPPHI